jgi:hypothetical protein
MGDVTLGDDGQPVPFTLTDEEAQTAWAAGQATKGGVAVDGNVTIQNRP